MGFHLPYLKSCIPTGPELHLYLPHEIWNLPPLATCLVEVIWSLENEQALFQEFAVIFYEFRHMQFLCCSNVYFWYYINISNVLLNMQFNWPPPLKMQVRQDTSGQNIAFLNIWVVSCWEAQPFPDVLN